MAAAAGGNVFDFDDATGRTPVHLRFDLHPQDHVGGVLTQDYTQQSDLYETGWR
jgi:hypothetical protein